MSKKPKPTPECDHVAGYIGRVNDPLVKLLTVSKLEEVNSRAEMLEKSGFTVTVFPWCAVCGERLLSGSYQAAPSTNGKIAG